MRILARRERKNVNVNFYLFSRYLYKVHYTVVFITFLPNTLINIPFTTNLYKSTLKISH